MPKEVRYEVCFRGKNEAESGVRPIDLNHAELRAYKPDDLAQYEVEREEADRRYDALVNAGILKTKVDGVVPHVVDLVEVTYTTKTGKNGETEERSTETLYWQYAERGAVRYTSTAKAA